jgi:hypothetical protein
MFTLYNTLVEFNTRLATAPQPVFHYNNLLDYLAINSSLPLQDSKLDSYWNCPHNSAVEYSLANTDCPTALDS